MKDGYYQYSISFASQITSPEELENVYLNINGRLLQIKDIARSGIRPREKRGIFFNGSQAIPLLGRDQTIQCPDVGNEREGHGTT